MPRAHPAARGLHVAVPVSLRSGASSAALPCQLPGLCWHTGACTLHPRARLRWPQWMPMWLHPMVSRGTERGESGIEQPAVRAAGFTLRTLESTTAPRVGPFRVQHLLSRSPLARGMFAGTLEPCLSRARMSDPPSPVLEGVSRRLAGCRAPSAGSGNAHK